MFERFTPRARSLIALAEAEVRRLNHGYIGTEHFLLGLIGERDGIASRVLRGFGMDAERVRASVERIIGLGDEPVEPPQLSLTPRMEKVLALSRSEADGMRHGYVGTEHLLLGLAHEGEGVANRIMDDYGATSVAVRETVVRLLSGGQH